MSGGWGCLPDSIGPMSISNGTGLISGIVSSKVCRTYRETSPPAQRDVAPTRSSPLGACLPTVSTPADHRCHGLRTLGLINYLAKLPFPYPQLFTKERR